MEDKKFEDMSIEEKTVAFKGWLQTRDKERFQKLVYSKKVSSLLKVNPHYRDLLVRHSNTIADLKAIEAQRKVLWIEINTIRMQTQQEVAKEQVQTPQAQD